MDKLCRSWKQSLYARFFCIFGQAHKTKEKFSKQTRQKTNKESTFQNVSQTIKKRTKIRNTLMKMKNGYSRPAVGRILAGNSSSWQAVFHKLFCFTSFPKIRTFLLVVAVKKEKKWVKNEKKKCFKVKSKVLSIRTCVSQRPKASSVSLKNTAQNSYLNLKYVQREKDFNNSSRLYQSKTHIRHGTI